MNTKKFSDAMGEIDDKYVDEAIRYQHTNKKHGWLKWGAMAACLCLIIGTIVIRQMNSDGQPGQRPICAYIQEDVTSVEVTHISMGDTVTWTVKGEELDELRNWTNSIKTQNIEFEDGKTPGDYEGGEVYSVTISQGDYPGFTCIISGENEYYFLVEGHWYLVTNPSPIPFTK